MQRKLPCLGQVACFLLAAFCAGPLMAQDSAKPVTVTETAAATDPALSDAIAAGKTLYLKNCRTCHGSKGTAGVPLAGNAKVQGDYGYLVWAIITGPGYMPEFGPALSDDQIAGIATYILNSWGNDYGIVTAENVHDQR